MSSLKVTVIVVLAGTPVAPSAGSVLLTTGATVSGAARVVKVRVYGCARGLPARSFTAPAGIDNVYVVLYAR